jgi:ParB-like chromosome segregation protein Spo0J
VSDFDRMFLHKPVFTPSPSDDVDDNELDQPDEEPSPAAGREGLPPTFRMRADSHYVDLITSRPAAPPVHLIAVKDIVASGPAEELELGPLVESITSLGVVQPLIVRRRKGRYELIAGSKRLAAAIAAGLSEVPCLLREADDDQARALAQAENLRLEDDDPEDPAPEAAPGVPAKAAREIIDSLATIESCLNLFLERDRPLRERVAVSLVRAEAHRARWLAEAYSVLGSEPVVTRRKLSPSIVIGRALRGVEAEGRLSNVRFALTIDEPARPLFADERLLSVALAGVAGAMLGLLQRTGEATLKVRVNTHQATRLLGIQFAQDLVAAPAAWRPAPAGQAKAGGHGEPLGLAAARRVMELHGGQLEVGSGSRGGCTVSLTLPAGD